MSAAQNLAYSVVQVVHNFGAVAAVGGSAAAVFNPRDDSRRKLAWLAFVGWGIQGASGAAFGAISYAFYHQLPDIAGAAVVALLVKMACVAAGFVLIAAYLLRASGWTKTSRDLAWRASLIFAALALTAAAVLRWFS